MVLLLAGDSTITSFFPVFSRALAGTFLLRQHRWVVLRCVAPPLQGSYQHKVSGKFTPVRKPASGGGAGRAPSAGVLRVQVPGQEREDVVQLLGRRAAVLRVGGGAVVQQDFADPPAQV